ncbi:MAG TPA: hypothetical protein VIR33_05235 [Thermopolyspora sp.]
MGCKAGGVLIRLLVATGLVMACPVAASASVRGGATRGAARGTTGDGVEGDRLLFRFRDKRISESSGIAVSPTHKGIYYTHNDSDAGPQFFAVGTDGRTRATFTLAGATARDWEAMAASVDTNTGRGVLWFADIGDNYNGAWPDISVYKVIEPEFMRDATLRATRYRFRYADGGRNAEGIMVHPGSGRLYVVSKEFSGSIYQAPAKLRTDRVNVLRRISDAPIMATDAAYSPDGSTFVIRTYFSASVYRAPGALIARVPMPTLKQAESITYTPDGLSLLTGSEGEDSPVYSVPLPADVIRRSQLPVPSATSSLEAGSAESKHGAAADATTRAVSSTSAAGHDSGMPVEMLMLWLVVACGATGVIAFVARRAR